MASTDAQIAKQICDALNDSRGHTQGRNPVQKAVYTSGASFVVTLREEDGNTDKITKTVSIS